MEKPKHKDGMLAAGKKRLEQFRQKKQGKGNASKHAKPETDLEHGGLRVDAERASSKNGKAKGSRQHTSSDDLEAANLRSVNGRNELSINLKVAEVDATHSQMNAEHISASVLDHCSEHEFKFEENALEQHTETGREKPQVANNDPCSRIDSLEPLGLDLNGSPPITAYAKAPVELQSSVDTFDSTSATVASDSSINVADLVVPNIDPNDGLMSHDDSRDLNVGKIVMNSFSSNHAEALEACDKEQESMNSATSACLTINEPVATTARFNTEHYDEKASELLEHIQLPNFSSQSCCKHNASSQDSPLHPALREDELESRHELDSGTSGMLPTFNSTSASLEHMAAAPQVGDKEQNSPSNYDAESVTDYIIKPGSNEIHNDTDIADTTHLFLSVMDIHSSPISETPVAADALEVHCSNTVMVLDSDKYSNMEQPRTEEIIDIHSGNRVTGILSDSNLDQVGLCQNDESGLETSINDSYHDRTPTFSREDMRNLAGREVVTVLDTSEPADSIAGLIYIKETALSGDLADDRNSINENAISVFSNMDGIACGATLVHTSDENSISTLSLNQNPETNFEGRSSSPEFHARAELGDTSKDGGVNADQTTVVKPDQEARESVHVEGTANIIQESCSGDVLSSLSSLPIPEAEQAITGEDQIFKASANSIDGEVGSAKVMEVEEIVTSDALHNTTHEAYLHDSDSGDGVSYFTMPVVCVTALKPEVDRDDPLDSVVAPSEECVEVQGVVEYMINEGLDMSTTKGVSLMQTDKVIAESVSGQNLTECGTGPGIKMEPFSEMHTVFLEHEQNKRPEVPCCDQELDKAKVSLEREIGEPDIAQHVVAVDDNVSDRIEEVADALPGGSFRKKHEPDTFAVDAEPSLSNRVEHELVSINDYAEHESENVSPFIKDDLPLDLLSRVDVHRYEADLKSDFTNQSHQPLDSGLTLDSDDAGNKAQVSDFEGALNSGNGIKLTERNNERGQESSEVSQFGLAMQSCLESNIECESRILESCKSYEIVTPVPLVMIQEETLEGETKHLSEDLSSDVVAEVYQHGTQERHLVGQLLRSFDKSDLPFESVQEHTWTGPKSTLIEKADLANTVNLTPSAGVSQLVGEQSRLNTGGSISYGSEEKEEAENVIMELQIALSMKETEIENYALLLNFQAAKYNEERGMAEEVLTHVVKRLINLGSQISTVNKDGDLHNEHLKNFDVDDRGLEKAELINFDHFLQASNHWIDELQKDLEEKRQTEIMRRQLDEAVHMKDSHIKGLTEKVMELSQNCDELQKDVEQMKDLETKAMHWQELSTFKDNEIGRLSDKVSELSQNYDVAVDEVAKFLEARVNLEGELKYIQKLYADQESKTSRMKDLLSIKDRELERLFDKIAELSQNYDLAMSEVAKSAEERSSLAEKLNHFQRLSAEQEEGHLKMCKQASALADKISSLLDPASITVDSIHDNVIETLENLVASLQEHHETVCRESKDLLLMASDSEAASQVEVNNIRALLSAKEVELAHLQEKVDSLTNELSRTRDEGERKVQEAEQKALGVRERLSLAVTKGKGLVQQRDNLKQLLAEKTAEFETLASSFNQELHSKAIALNEAEIRAKVNSEAVECVEALESELSYIRNSANALRESFLQKDAVLQKIEELFEDANLPEELQDKDIYEKVEWLLEANTQKISTLEGQDHSETMATREMNAFTVAEHGSQMQEIDQLNRKCDELLRKYSGMAEQSAMLEQSLLERNHLIQRWEEILDAVDMPASIRLKEPEDKIKWLGATMSDAHASITQFQAEIESLQRTIESLNNAFQKLQEENAMLSMELTANNDELKMVRLDLEDMTVKCNNFSKPTYEGSTDGMLLPQAGLRGLEESEHKQEVCQQPLFQIEDSEAFVTNICTLLSEVIQRDELDAIFSDGLANTAVEKSVKLVVENYKVCCTEATEAKDKLAELTLAMKVAENDREKDIQSLHEALSLKTLELSDVSKQLESFTMKKSLLESEVDHLQNTVKAIFDELSSAKDELGKSQLEASQLEDKLASTREKLSMAVKKGKSVVQQRDALKQSLDERTTEVSQIRKELEAESVAFSNAKQSLELHLQQIEMLEAELLSSRNYACNLKKSVQESNRTLQKFAEAVDQVSISGAPRSGDLGEKIQWISQLILDLQRKAGISEQEAKKSKKSTELLALELEEVQGRMDSLNEELKHAEKNISLLIEEKKLAEASRAEAGLRLEHAMANVNSLLFELSELRENQASLEQENNSLKDILSAQMEEFRYKQGKAEDQLKDLNDLCSKVYHLKANQSTFLDMVADQVLSLSEDTRETKSLVLRILGELKDQGFISLLTAPVFGHDFLSKWQPKKTAPEWKEEVTTGALKLLCDEMETELHLFTNFLKSFVTALNQDSMAISQLLIEISDGLGLFSQEMLNLRRDANFVSSTESIILQKDEQIRVLEEVLKAATERLRCSIEEMQNLREKELGQVPPNGASPPHLLDDRVPHASYEDLQALTFSLVEKFSFIAKNLAWSYQQQDIQKDRENENLRNQLSKARAVIDAMDHEQQVDKLKNTELQKCLEESEVRQDSLRRTNQELSSLNDILSKEKQEKEGLVETLKNAETKIGELLVKVEELEKAKQEVEASLGKASSRFYTTVSNFNRFQSLSEKLIEEAESLHLLLEDRDAQISLLKEELALKGSEVTSLQNLVNEKTIDLSQLYQKIDEIVNRDAGRSESLRLERPPCSREELLEALASSVRVGTEGLQMQLARKDALLQDIQLRHDDLARKVSMLESSLLENQRLTEERGRTSVIDRMMISVEAEDKGNTGKHVAPSVAAVTHGRGGRKVSALSDHLALDVDSESSRLLADMDDEDKGHVFKPLTSSRLVPRGTRILVDRLDGLWVSGERLMRRRPGARLGVMLYWLVLHIWMAAILL